MRRPLAALLLLAACALAGCRSAGGDAPKTTGTDVAADVAATGDATAGTLASPGGLPASGATGAGPTAQP